MGKYYSLSLLNNLYSVTESNLNFGNILRRDKICDVISLGKNRYESVLVMGVEIDGKIYDVVSGLEIKESSISDKPNPNLCYSSKSIISKEDVAMQLKKLKVEDIKKYVACLKEIEKESLDNYLRYKECIDMISKSNVLNKVI